MISAGSVSLFRSLHPCAFFNQGKRAIYKLFDIRGGCLESGLSVQASSWDS